MKPGASEGAVDVRERISNGEVERSTRSKRETREKTQTGAEPGAHVDDDEKSQRVKSERHSDTFEETVFEKLSTPLRPAVVTMPNRWETKNKKEIEHIRKKYKRNKSKRSKMTLSDLSFMSHFGLEESNKKEGSSPTQSSIASVREKKPHQKPETPKETKEEKAERVVEKEQCKTIEVEPEPKTLKPKEAELCHQSREVLSPVTSPSSPYFTAPTSQPNSDVSEKSTRSRKLHKVKARVKEGTSALLLRGAEFLHLGRHRNDDKSERKPKIREKEIDQQTTSIYSTAPVYSPQNNGSSPNTPSPAAHPQTRNHHKPSSHRKHHGVEVKK